MWIEITQNSEKRLSFTEMVYNSALMLKIGSWIGTWMYIQDNIQIRSDRLLLPNKIKCDMQFFENIC